MRIGAYEVLLELGRGGMGAVYLARLSGAGEFERLVAIKRALPQSLLEGDTRDRFLHEARLAAYVHHANVVGIHQVGNDEVGPYLACDYVEGESLSGLIDRTRRTGRIPPSVALRIVIDALAGLAAIHDAVDSSGRALGILHRDVSIENLLVGRDGVTRITDFGIAKSIVSPVKTEAGTIHGKLLYLTPEYLMGKAPDRSCDTYAMGITLFAALTSTYPFKIDDMNLLVEQIYSESVPSLRSRGVDVSDELERVLAKACQRDRAQRFPDARGMLDALEEAGEASVGVARQHDVEAFVEQVAGQALRTRRELLQARRAELVPGVRHGYGVSAPPPVLERPEPWSESPVPVSETVSRRPPPLRRAAADKRAVIAGTALFFSGVAGFFYLNNGTTPKPRPPAASVSPDARPDAIKTDVQPDARLVVPSDLTRDAGRADANAPSAADDAGVADPALPSARVPQKARTRPNIAVRPVPAAPTPASPTGVPPTQKPAEPKPPEPAPGISLQNPYRNK